MEAQPKSLKGLVQVRINSYKREIHFSCDRDYILCKTKLQIIGETLRNKEIAKETWAEITDLLNEVTNSFQDLRRDTHFDNRLKEEIARVIPELNNTFALASYAEQELKSNKKSVAYGKAFQKCKEVIFQINLQLEEPEQ